MHNEFKPGFRLSITDCFVLAIAVAGSMYFYDIAKALSYIIGMVVVHFFLFCNVVRMSRVPELIWASSFTVLCIAALHLEAAPLWAVFVVSLLLTTILVGLELRKPSYHGVAWRKLNPELKSWFEERLSKKS